MLSNEIITRISHTIARAQELEITEYNTAVLIIVFIILGLVALILGGISKKISESTRTTLQMCGVAIIVLAVFFYGIVFCMSPNTFAKSKYYEAYSLIELYKPNLTPEQYSSFKVVVRPHIDEVH